MDAHGIPWDVQWDAHEMHTGCTRYFMGCPRDIPWKAHGMPTASHGVPVRCERDSSEMPHGIPTRCPWDARGILAGCPRGCAPYMMRYPWDTTGSLKRCSWDAHHIPWDAHGKFITSHEIPTVSYGRPLGSGDVPWNARGMLHEVSTACPADQLGIKRSSMQKPCLPCTQNCSRKKLRGMPMGCPRCPMGCTRYFWNIGCPWDARNTPWEVLEIPWDPMGSPWDTSGIKRDMHHMRWNAREIQMGSPMGIQ